MLHISSWYWLWWAGVCPWPCLVCWLSRWVKWEQGCYTLVHDTDCEGLEFALDLVLCVGCQGEWSEKVGAGMLHISSRYWYRGPGVCPWPCRVCWLSRWVKWEQGCYTLVHDTDCDGLELAHDLVLYVGCQGEKVGAGMLHISSQYWYRGTGVFPWPCLVCWLSRWVEWEQGCYT